MEIGVDKRLRFVRRRFQTLRKTPAGNAIQNRKVDGFGAATRVAVYFAEQFQCRARMNVFALFKGIAQGFHIRKMRGKPKLDLAIVGGQDHIAGFGDKSVPDLTTRFGTNGNILQVRIGR